MLLPSKLKDMDSLIIHVTMSLLKGTKSQQQSPFLGATGMLKCTYRKVEFLTMKYDFVVQETSV